ncbi:putative reverse transcriptase domain-containing protein [Tanacetum coccineum]|uniref:Reverse transcriptase domain-containing protein n=1 Tax=Tanacetum coccineum TaxID=301880 RepID=A0ABQ5G154_9ASTR
MLPIGYDLGDSQEEVDRQINSKSLKIKKLEISMKSKVKGNDVAAYTQCFQELALMCTKFLVDETEKVDKNQKLPHILQERQMIDKRKADDIIKNTHHNNPQESKMYLENTLAALVKEDVKLGPNSLCTNVTGNLPLCTKCNYHHTGQCVPKYGNCKRYGHTINDCQVNTNNNNNNNNKNQKAGACYECGNTRHIKKNCTKLKNRENGNENGTAQGRAYALGGRDDSPDSNVITGTFLLNNRYAIILFDTGADISFVSNTFSALIDITPTTLENHYDVELADGKIIGVNTII